MRMKTRVIAIPPIGPEFVVGAGFDVHLNARWFQRALMTKDLSGRVKVIDNTGYLYTHKFCKPIQVFSFGIGSDVLLYRLPHS